MMSDEKIPTTVEAAAEEAAEAGRTFTERVSVSGGELIETVQSLLREAAVRKITVQDKDGRTLIEIPLYAGVAGALILGWATVLALIAAWFAQVSILIERDHGHDKGEPTVVGQAVERAAGSASSTASNLLGGVTAFLGSASRGAGEAARRAADALETRLNSAADKADEVADKAEAIDVQGVVTEATTTAQAAAGDARQHLSEALDSAGEAIQTGASELLPGDTSDAGALLAASEPRQCAAVTKAGTRCKRQAIAGSEFCSMHQIA
jgi:hypothetical protein